MMDDSERAQRFEALERFRAGLPAYDEEEVLADATAAVEEVRRARKAEAAASPPGEAPAPDDGEMGGEAPCQLHRFWDVEE
ncbi:MAG TPA: hypothetical protein VM890_16155 [Longimicrobium sp.]|jgi:hypothetical protein|nr:hypothetical protein [Longimicrobium sp.]